jgi:hypothetical protein
MNKDNSRKRRARRLQLMHPVLERMLAASRRAGEPLKQGPRLKECGFPKRTAVSARPPEDYHQHGYQQGKHPATLSPLLSLQLAGLRLFNFHNRTFLDI